MDDEMFVRRMDSLLHADELEAAMRAKKTTAVLLQKLVHEPNGIDDFIAQVNRAQLALEHMKNFAKDLKVAKILKDAQDAKEAEERHLEVLQERAERMVKEERRVTESMFRDAGRCQGPMERNLKASLKEHAALLNEQKALLKEQKALLRQRTRFVDMPWTG